ncbi:MAG: hypothetical protein EXX96DRAFT_545678 [Benjaminiella poitrasii]|nr:MAG: hypothetical protein EXX96DRAFT_545678 [Benjaminiella poitrasii]
MTTQASPNIKTDPVLYGDQDDLLLSYLHSDCLSTASYLNDNNPMSDIINKFSDNNLDFTSTHNVHDHQQNCTSPYGSSIHIPYNNVDRSNLSNIFSMDGYQQHQTSSTAAMLRSSFLNSIAYMIPILNNQLQQESVVSSIENNTTSMISPCTHLISPQPSSPSSLSSHSSFSSDSNQSKKRRGRKKKYNSNQIINSITSNGTKVIAPSYIPNTPTSTKQLPMILPAYKPQREYLEKQNVLNAAGSLDQLALDLNKPDGTDFLQDLHTQPSVHNQIVSNKSPLSSADDFQKSAATLAKKQERLIKNRAAALLSRKRKREHLTALENQCSDLSKTNKTLHDKIMELEQTNFELKKKLGEQKIAKNSFILAVDRLNGNDFILMVFLCYFMFIFSVFSYTILRLTPPIKYTKDARLLPNLLERSDSSLTLSFELESYHSLQKYGDKQEKQ